MIQANLFLDTPQYSGGSKIPVGIHQGCIWSGMTVESDYLDLNFSNKEGQQIHRRLSKPTGASPKENETPVEALEREITLNIQHVVKMMQILLDPAVVNDFKAETYTEFVKNAAVLLNEKKGELVNLKVTADYKNPVYPSLSYFPRYVEKYQEGVPTRLKFSKQEEEQAAKHRELKEQQ